MGHAGNEAVLFQSYQKTYFLVSEELQVLYRTVPGVCCYPCRTQAPAIDFINHLAEVIIFCLMVTIAIHPPVDRQADACCIAIVEHKEVNAFDTFVMQATPEEADQFSN